MNTFLYSRFLKFVFILPFYLFFLFSDAQTLLPDITISNGSTSYDNYSKITLDNEGNLYCIANYSNNPFFNNTPVITFGSSNIILSKFDKDGTFIWCKTIAYGSNIVPSDIIWENEKITISGYFLSNLIFLKNNNTTRDTLKSNGHYDVFVAQLQSDGTLIHKKSFGSSEEDKIVEMILINKNIVITGTFYNYIEFDPLNPNELSTLYSAGNRDLFLTCLDPNLNLIWAKRAGGYYHDIVEGMALYNDEIYLTGSFVNNMNFNTPSSGNGNVLSAYGYGDIFVAKYDKFGNPHWIKRAGSSGDEYNFEISYEKGNDLFINKYGVYVIGNVYSKSHFNGPEDTNFTIYNSFNTYGRFFAHYSHDGTIKWVKELKTISMYDSPLLHGSDNYIGISENFRINFSEYSTYYQDSISFIKRGSLDYVTRLFDFNGTFITGASIGSVNSESVTDIIVLKNQIYLSGSFSGLLYFNDGPTSISEIVSKGSDDIFIARYPFPDFIVDTVEIPNYSLKLFPNPAEKQITITNTTDQIGLNYFLYDIMGKMVFQGALIQNENIINISNLNAGIYFVKIMTTKPKTFKFIKY